MQKFYWPSKGCVTGYRHDNSSEIFLGGFSDNNYTAKHRPSYIQVNTAPTQIQVNRNTEGVNTPKDIVRSIKGSHTVVLVGGEHGDKICMNSTHRSSTINTNKNSSLSPNKNSTINADRSNTIATDRSSTNTTCRSTPITTNRSRVVEDMNTPVTKTGCKVTQRLKHKNKTWNQGTLSQAEYLCGVRHQRARGTRQSIQNVDFSNHNYENVYDGDEDMSHVTEELQNMNMTSQKQVHDANTKCHANNRQTPRSRKKSKAPIPLHRSKSCDRIGVGATLLDNLSCMSKSGRTSPTDSLYGQADNTKDQASPSQSLAHKLRGRLSYVNRKMNMIRSRSAERLRGVCAASGRSEVIAVDHRGVTRPAHTGTVHVYSGPVIGQARAVVDCVPSPYDKDALTFSKDDLIDIIHMNASGLWWGRSGNRVGHFKFVNVEILPARTRRRSRSRSLRRVKRKPGTVAEVMRVLNMEQHLPVFVLNGYEDLTLFKDLDDEELDYLGISDEDQREKLIAMAELLFPDDTTDNKTVDKDDSDDISSESGVADVHSDDSVHSEQSYHSKGNERGK